MSAESDAIKDVAREINELRDISKQVDYLKRAVEALTKEVAEVKQFKPVADRLSKTNEHLAKIADELFRIRSKE
jgi:division protein CdvB (Snf7/Vps24/ESCRT-III family)